MMLHVKHSSIHLLSEPLIHQGCGLLEPVPADHGRVVEYTRSRSLINRRASTETDKLFNLHLHLRAI